MDKTVRYYKIIEFENKAAKRRYGLFVRQSVKISLKKSFEKDQLFPWLQTIDGKIEFFVEEELSPSVSLQNWRFFSDRFWPYNGFNNFFNKSCFKRQEFTLDKSEMDTMTMLLNHSTNWMGKKWSGVKTLTSTSWRTGTKIICFCVPVMEKHFARFWLFSVLI